MKSRSILAIVAFSALQAYGAYVTGTVKDQSGNAMSGITVQLTGGRTATATTGSDGLYNFTPLFTRESYIVTASHSGCTFTPSSYTFSPLKVSQDKVDFVADCYPAAPVLVSPPDAATGVPVSSVTLSWTPSPAAQSYDVYFGPEATPALVGNTTSTTYSVGTLVQNTTYHWRVVAKNSFGTASSVYASFTTVVPPAGGGLGFVPITPCRVVDTRPGEGKTGPFGPPIIAGQSTRVFPIPAGDCSIPATAAAYSVSVAVVPSEPLGYLTVWPTGTPQPYVSTVNSLKGTTMANAAIVPAGDQGAISVFAANTTHVVIDINGYFDAQAGDSGLSFYTLPGCRFIDTRESSMLLGQTVRDFDILGGACGFPTSAAAYSFAVTAVPPAPLGYLTMWPTGRPQPYVSTVNSLEGLVVTNAALVPAGDLGKVSVFASNDTDMVIDTNGYFAAAGSTNALTFHPILPCRLLDTRDADGTFGGPVLSGGSAREFPVSASTTCAVPPTAKAYSLNVTAVPDGQPLGYVTLWPTGSTQPNTTTLASIDGTTIANAALVQAGTNGAFSVFVSNTTHLVIDMNGYFAQ